MVIIDKQTKGFSAALKSLTLIRAGRLRRMFLSEGSRQQQEGRSIPQINTNHNAEYYMSVAQLLKQSSQALIEKVDRWGGKVL